MLKVGRMSREFANGSMATVATRRRENPCPEKREKNDLTPTGLLMEGVYPHNPWSELSECNDSITMSGTYHQ